MPGSRRTRALLGASVLIGALLLAIPSDTRAGVIRALVLVIGIAVVALYLRRSGPATASTAEQFEAELRRSTETPPSVPGIRAVEMAVRLSTASAQDFDVRLRPLLRDLACWRLLGHRGVDMDAKPDAARRILGEPLAGLVDNAAAPKPFGAPGVSLAILDAGLDQLEQI